MRRIALSMAVVGAMWAGANRALAEGALSYPMAAHVAAKYGVQHSGLPTEVKLYHQAKFRHDSRREIHGSHGYHGGYGGSYGRPPVVVRPYYVNPQPYYYAPYYAPRPYYYQPSGITYRGQGFSIGIGF